jgi:predicted deacylase
MTQSLEEIRALTLMFDQSSWRDLYVRTHDWTVFMAKTDGAANPMQGAVLVPGQDANIATITAPHLGIFEPMCKANDVIADGALIGQIDVLGRKTDVRATGAGRISAIKFAAHDLVQYGESLFEVAG